MLLGGRRRNGQTDGYSSTSRKAVVRFGRFPSSCRAMTRLWSDNCLVSRWKPPRRKPIRKPPQKPVPVGIGNSIEQEAFLTANPARVKAIEDLYATAKKVFLRKMQSDKPADRVGFYLGRICVEDFSEIFVLAGNGHGVGALKILRGMYERAVTSAYSLPILTRLMTSSNTTRCISTRPTCTRRSLASMAQTSLTRR
jgi:hypothetical protein